MRRITQSSGLRPRPRRRTLFTIALASAGGLAALLLILSLAGTRRLRDLYDRERVELIDRAKRMPMEPANPRPAADLPLLVQQYSAAVGSAGGDLRVATLAQRGQLRTAPDKPWMPFTAEQVYTFQPLGFVWFAKAHVAPLVHILARDKFIDAKGNMLISLLGFVTLADAKGHELDLGAGLRFWGEIATFPEALRSPLIRWQELGEQRVVMNLEQGPLTMSAILEFGTDGLLRAVHADRYRDVDGTSVLTRWSGMMGGWTRLDGRLLPTHWKSVWHLDTGDFVAVEMQILSVHVE